MFSDYFSLPPALQPGFSARESLHGLWALPWLLSVALLFARLFPSQFYDERYGFEWAFFTHRLFFTLRSFTKIFRTVCDSDTGRNTPSRILLCTCPHIVVPFGWRMDLTYSYCSYKTINLSIEPVSHEV